jgi:DNA-binding transcriptional regulator YiaG
MSSPTPEQIKDLRTKAGRTQAECAAMLHTSLRSYQQWEAGDRRMHPAFWELLNIKLTIIAHSQ